MFPQKLLLIILNNHLNLNLHRILYALYGGEVIIKCTQLFGKKDKFLESAQTILFFNSEGNSLISPTSLKLI